MFSSLNQFIQQCFDVNFSCAATKAMSIAKWVFAPRAQRNLESEISSASFFSVHFDGSTVHNRKLLPIFASFYQSGHVRNRLLDIKELDDDTALSIFNAVTGTIKEYKISKDKIVAIVADNCPTNFGQSGNRTGDGNVFALLQEEFEGKLIGIGCLAHILHNSVKTAAGKIKSDLDLDVLKILYQLYKYFEGQPKRAKGFLHLCALLGVNCGVPKNFVSTRWLSMNAAVDTLIAGFDTFREYFETATGKNVEAFRKFFNHPRALAWLIVLKSTSSLFEEAVITVEGPNMTLLPAIEIFHELKDEIDGKEKNRFIPELVESECMQGWSKKDCDQFRNDVQSFYKECSAYMNNWTKWANPLRRFCYVRLDKKLSFGHILDSLRYFKDNEVDIVINDKVLKDEVSRANVYITANIQEWNTKDESQKKYPMTSIERWDKVFTNVENLPSLKRIVEFTFALPGTNATCERLFSEIKFFWTKWKSRMNLSTVIKIMKIRFNYSKSWNEIFSMLIKDSDFRDEVRSNHKYQTDSCKAESDIHSMAEMFSMGLDELDFEFEIEGWDRFVETVYSESEEEDEDLEEICTPIKNLNLTGKVESKRAVSTPSPAMVKKRAKKEPGSGTRETGRQIRQSLDFGGEMVNICFGKSYFY